MTGTALTEAKNLKEYTIYMVEIPPNIQVNRMIKMIKFI